MSSPVSQALAVSHVLVPWVIVARRLRSGHALPPPPPAAEVAPVTAEAPRQARRKGKKSRTKEIPRAKVAAPTPTVGVEPARVRPHHSLLCPGCGAPVRLAEAPFACPHCAAEIVPPPDVIAAYRHVVWAKQALERAERAWRRAVLWNAPVLVVLFAILFTAWAAAYGYLVFTGPSNQYDAWSKPERVLYFASAPSGLFGAWLGLFGSVNAGTLKGVVANVPRGAFTSLPLQAAACSHRGGGVTFANGRFTTLCVYCGAEEIRASLAKDVAREARSVRQKAGESIVEAYRAIVARREMLFRFFDLLAALQIVLVVFEVARWNPVLREVIDFIGQFA